MTAASLVEKAGVKAGLCVAGAVPAALAAMGLADLNRWYRYVWNKYPHRDIRLAEADVEVSAGATAVALPTAVDGIFSMRGPNGALLPLSDAAAADASEIWLGASGTPCRYLSLPDGVDGDSKPVRRIRLAPVPAAALTVSVIGLRRFAELAGGDSVLLTRCEDALYFYVLGELYRFLGDDANRKAAFADAVTHFEVAFACEDKAAETDNVMLPAESFL